MGFKESSNRSIYQYAKLIHYRIKNVLNMLDKTENRWYGKLTKWQIDKFGKWWSVKMTKWQDDKMTRWWNDETMKWHDVEMARLCNDKMKKQTY